MMCIFDKYREGRTFFFFNDTATTEIYTLSLHDALPICGSVALPAGAGAGALEFVCHAASSERHTAVRYLRRCSRRSEEHTSELQSRQYLVCRLLLEKKNNIIHSSLILFRLPLPYGVTAY